MKTSKFLSFALLFAATGLTMNSCSVSDNEKMPEQVTDPIADKTMYYIVGQVSDESNQGLSGVEVETEGADAVQTDNNGEFKIEVEQKGDYTLKASKDGYLSVTANVSVASNASNRSSVSASMRLTKKAVAKSVNQTEETKIEDKDSKALITIPANTVNDAQTTVTMTPYVADQTITNTSSSVMNLYIETNKDISVTDDKSIEVSVKAPINSATFEELDVYKKTTLSRAAEGFAHIGKAKYNSTSQLYTFKLTEGTLEGDYAFAANYTRTESSTNTETIKEDKVDNSGNFEAKTDVSITYTAKMGWSYEQDPNNALLSNAIEAREGTEGIYNVSYNETTNVSGNSIMYWNAKNAYTTVTYTFNTTGRTTTVKLKKYTGVQFSYTNQSADQHSGGTSGAN